jgi:hypothetical protein
VALHASKLFAEFNQWQQQLPEATGVATSVRTVCYYLMQWRRYYWRQQQQQSSTEVQAVDYLVQQLGEAIAAANTVADNSGKARTDVLPDFVVLDTWLKQIDAEFSAAKAELRKVTWSIFIYAMHTNAVISTDYKSVIDYRILGSQSAQACSITL